jgi:hypothetical protein
MPFHPPATEEAAPLRSGGDKSSRSLQRVRRNATKKRVKFDGVDVKVALTE